MYAPVSALRSTRYPLAGLGCGCSPPVSGLGQLLASATGIAAGFSVAMAGGAGLVAGYFLGKHAQRAGLALNGRRRRRSRR